VSSVASIILPVKTFKINPVYFGSAIFVLVLTSFFVFGCAQGVNDPDPSLQPRVISYSPTNEATNVVLNSMISAQFSTTLDASTISPNTFVVSSAGEKVGGDRVYFPIEKTIVFTPSQELAANTVFDVAVTSGLKSNRGMSAFYYTWHFSTGASTGITPRVSAQYPASREVALTNAKLWARFNTDMSTNSINPQSFTLYGPAGKITSTITYEPNNAYYSLAPIGLTPATTYVATIFATVTSVLGVPLEANHSWIFYTSSVEMPSIDFYQTISSYTNETTAVVTGSAFAQALSNISSIEYRIDSADTWSSTRENISGTLFSQRYETFRLVVPGLSDGTHTIEARAVDSVGNVTALAEYAVDGFTIDTTPFRVIDWHPNTFESLAYPTYEVIRVTFNKSVMQNNNPIYSGAFTVCSSLAAVSGTIGGSGGLYSFYPSPKLQYGTTYFITVDATVVDEYGNYLDEPFRWTFNTTTEPALITWTQGNGTVLPAVYGHTMFASVDPSPVLKFFGGNINGSIPPLISGNPGSQYCSDANNGLSWHSYGTDQQMPGRQNYMVGFVRTDPQGFVTVGGRTTGGVTNDVWFSNYVEWSPVVIEPALPAPKIEYSTIDKSDINSDLLYMFGGSVEGQYTNEAWMYNTVSTPDSWPSLGLQTFPPRAGHTLTHSYAHSAYFIIGGKTGAVDGNEYSNQIWRTASLEVPSWTQVTPNGELFSARAFHTCVEYNDKLWVIGGMTTSGATNDVWASSDGGVNWIKAPIPDSFAPRSQHSAVAFNNGVIITGGLLSSGVGTNEAWYFTR